MGSASEGSSSQYAGVFLPHKSPVHRIKATCGIVSDELPDLVRAQPFLGRRVKRPVLAKAELWKAKLLNISAAAHETKLISGTKPGKETITD